MASDPGGGLPSWVSPATAIIGTLGLVIGAGLGYFAAIRSTTISEDREDARFATQIAIELTKIALSIDPTPFLTIPEATLASATDPADAVVSYYATINAGDYESAWDMLTDKFKENSNPTGFEAYKGYWVGASPVTIKEIGDVISSGPLGATVRVHIIFPFGTDESNDIYTMVRESENAPWLIDRVDPA